MKKEDTNKKLILIIAALLGAVLFGILSVMTFLTDTLNIRYGAEELSAMYRPDHSDYLVKGMSLPKGIYEITLMYDAGAGAKVENTCKMRTRHTLVTDDPELSPYEHTKTMTVWVYDKAEDFTVRIKDKAEETPALTVYEVKIRTLPVSKCYGIVRYLTGFALCYLLVFLFFKREALRPYAGRILGIGAITMIASLPLFTRFVLIGHDLNFHLLRIEGLKEAILAGDIPVKVQTNWNFGYGYAVSFAYGDLTLLLPALMRVLGFPLQTSYKTFVFTVNLLTALSAYLCLKPFCRKNETAALLVSFLYTLAPYRLCCVYIRAAFGEYTGMIFLPMIALGLYRIYTEDPEAEDYGKKLLLPVLGFTGLLQTHMLSCVMLAIFLVIFGLMLWRRTFRKKTLLALAKIAGCVIVLNLWFLVPLLSFLREPLYLHVRDGYKSDFQHYGLSIAELFAQRSSGTYYFNWAYLTNLGNRMSMPLGNGFAILLGTYGVLAWTKGAFRKQKKIGYFALLGSVAVFMATNLFPYDLIQKYLEPLSKLITRVNVPYRYLTMAIFFFAIFTAFFFGPLKKKLKKESFLILMTAVLLVSADQSFDYLYGVLYNGPVGTYYDGVNLTTNDLVGYEYLYEGTDYRIIEQDREIASHDITLDSASRRYNRYDLMVRDGKDQAYVELPLFYYPGYVARTKDGKELSLIRGNNNRLRIGFPAGFSGEILVNYKEPVLWRICEILSLLGLLGLIVYTRRNRKTTEVLS